MKKPDAYNPTLDEVKIDETALTRSVSEVVSYFWQVYIFDGLPLMFKIFNDFIKVNFSISKFLLSSSFDCGPLESL